eukprot:TRINITY_DN22130_c1_g1_i1.p1 TRINITY_DN22130_c1_g1~~TRINITY_DN22130_c1_g1_i1.p1  ORF type:complete len:252 (+),score=58.23 TRINITY_DN22130_c1_g1_i1:96-758(+)
MDVVDLDFDDASQQQQQQQQQHDDIDAPMAVAMPRRPGADSPRKGEDDECYEVNFGRVANTDVTRKRRQREFEGEDETLAEVEARVRAAHEELELNYVRRRARIEAERATLVRNAGWEAVMQDPRRLTKKSLEILKGLQGVGFPVSNSPDTTWGVEHVLEHATSHCPELTFERFANRMLYWRRLQQEEMGAIGDMDDDIGGYDPRDTSPTPSEHTPEREP